MAMGSKGQALFQLCLWCLYQWWSLGLNDPWPGFQEAFPCLKHLLNNSNVPPAVAWETNKGQSIICMLGNGWQCEWRPVFVAGGGLDGWWGPRPSPRQLRVLEVPTLWTDSVSLTLCCWLAGYLSSALWVFVTELSNWRNQQIVSPSQVLDKIL